MSLEVQFAFFIIIIVIVAWLIFYKPILKLSRKLNKHLENIKEEINNNGRDKEK